MTGSEMQLPLNLSILSWGHLTGRRKNELSDLNDHRCFEPNHLFIDRIDLGLDTAGAKYLRNADGSPSGSR